MTTDDDYNMGLEFDSLDDETKAEIRLLVEKVRWNRRPEAKPFREGDVYAYPHPGGGVAWGVNGAPQGFNIARGVSKPKPRLI
jgi:hypothetical protein